jgi:hypothetical protein
MLLLLLLIVMRPVLTTASCALQLPLHTAHVLHRIIPLLSEIINNCTLCCDKYPIPSAVMWKLRRSSCMAFYDLGLIETLVKIFHVLGVVGFAVAHPGG